MNVQDPLQCVSLFFILLSPGSSTTPKCGVFNVESPELRNGSLVLRENTIVNITFSLPQNCNILSIGSIDISKWIPKENMFARQCTIFQPCKDQPVPSNVSCHCLGSQGFYGFTLVVQRHHGTHWKWSTSSSIVDDVILEFDVTYPPLITRLTVEGYAGPIPRFENVSVMCSWQDGNPPSSVSLLDRHNNLLKEGNNSIHICYTFSSVDCNDTGVIRCEADGADKNMSAMMLIECPLEIVMPLPKVMSVIVGQNSDVTFPFRSHTSRISDCHMTQLNRNKNTNAVLFKSPFSLNNLITDEDYLSLGNRSCEYAVIGVPPEFHISIKLRNLKTEDMGLWYVNVSNNVGSDAIFIQVHIINGINPTANTIKKEISVTSSERIVNEGIKSEMMLSPIALSGVVLGAIVFTVVVFLIIYYIKKGRKIYSQLKKRRKTEIAVYRPLGTDPEQNVLNHVLRESNVYYEIKDAAETTGKLSQARQNPNESDTPSSHDSENRVPCVTECPTECPDGDQISFGETGVMAPSKAPRFAQHAQVEIAINNNVSAKSDQIQSVDTENETIITRTTADYLEPIQRGCQANVSEEMDGKQCVQTFSETGIMPMMPDYLKPTMPGNGKGVSLSMADYLKLIEPGSNTDTQSILEDYLKLIHTRTNTDTQPTIEDYLKLIHTKPNTDIQPKIEDYLKLIRTRTNTDTQPTTEDYLKLIHTRTNTDTQPTMTEYLKPIQPGTDTCNSTTMADYLKLSEKGGETGSVCMVSDYLKPILEREQEKQLKNDVENP